MVKFLKSKIISLIIVSSLLLQASCGYILHPERRNQPSLGEVDMAVVGLDAIGLLFFVIPGVIAFAVDISSNTIYFPKNYQKFSSSGGVIKDPKAFTKLKVFDESLRSEVAKIVKENTGKDLLASDEILVLNAN